MATCQPSSKLHTNSAASLLDRPSSLAAGGLGWRLKRHIPDIAGVLADGAVGGEPRHVRNVPHAHLCPVGGRLPEDVDAALGGGMVIAVGSDHVIVLPS